MIYARAGKLNYQNKCEEGEREREGEKGNAVQQRQDNKLDGISQRSTAPRFAYACRQTCYVLPRAETEQARAAAAGMDGLILRIERPSHFIFGNAVFSRVLGWTRIVDKGGDRNG